MQVYMCFFFFFFTTYCSGFHTRLSLYISLSCVDQYMLFFFKENCSLNVYSSDLFLKVCFLSFRLIMAGGGLRYWSKTTQHSLNIPPTAGVPSSWTELQIMAYDGAVPGSSLSRPFKHLPFHTCTLIPTCFLLKFKFWPWMDEHFELQHGLLSLFSSVCVFAGYFNVFTLINL